MHRAPAAIIAAAAFCGVMAVAARSVVEIASAAVVMALALYLGRNLKYCRAVFFSVFVLMACLTAVRAPHALEAAAPKDYRAEVGDIRRSAGSQRLIVTTSDGVRTSLRISSISPQIYEGDSIAFHAQLLSVNSDNAANRYSSTARHNRAGAVEAMVALRPYDVRIIGHSNKLRYRFSNLRYSLADAVYSTPLSPGAARLLSAALLGTGDAEPAIKEQFRATGLSHLLCVSGFHVGVVAMIVALLLRPFNIMIGGRRRSLIAVVIIWCYAILTGFTPSVIRASAMISVFFLCRALLRRAMPFNALCLAFAVVLAIDPYSLFSVGFQLSFSAVAAILIFTEPVRKRRGIFGNKYACRLGQWTIPAIASTVGTMPVLLAWFHRLPLLAVPFNIIGVAIFPVFMISAIIAVALWWISPAFSAPCRIVNELYGIVEDMLNAATPLAARWQLSYAPTTLALAGIVLSLILLAAVIHCPQPRRRRAVAFAMIPCLFAGACSTRTVSPAFAAMIIDGNSSSCHVNLISEGEGRVIAFDDEPPAFTSFEKFFSDNGIMPEDVIFSKSERPINTPFGTVAPAPQTAEIILIPKNFRDDLEKLISDRVPRMIIVSSEIDAVRRRAYRYVAAKHGIEFHDLAVEGPLLLK